MPWISSVVNTRFVDTSGNTSGTRYPGSLASRSLKIHTSQLLLQSSYIVPDQAAYMCNLAHQASGQLVEAPLYSMTPEAAHFIALEC